MSRDEEQEILDRARRREELERRGYTRRKCDTCRGFGVYADGCECLSCDGKGYRWYAPITK